MATREQMVSGILKAKADTEARLTPRALEAVELAFVMRERAAEIEHGCEFGDDSDLDPMERGRNNRAITYARRLNATADALVAGKVDRPFALAVFGEYR